MRSFKTAFTEPMLTTYQSGVMSYTYRGVRCLKSPIDIALYMKLLWELKPRLVLEIGSHSGGSALLLRDLLRNFDLDTQIVSVDLNPPNPSDREGITFLRGDVMNLPALFGEHEIGDIPHPWFVTEDSAHSYAGCTAALTFFSKQMQPGDILAMEDGVLDDLDLSEKYDGGPNRAIKEFLDTNPNEFRVMTELCDMFGPHATYNPNGYLEKS